jgi:hypothetical protein
LAWSLLDNNYFFTDLQSQNMHHYYCLHVQMGTHTTVGTHLVMLARGAHTSQPPVAIGHTVPPSPLVSTFANLLAGVVAVESSEVLLLLLLKVPGVLLLIQLHWLCPW